MSVRKVPISEKSVMILINEVKKRRCVWDVEDATYNDRYKIALAWEQIADLLNLPGHYLLLSM